MKALKLLLLCALLMGAADSGTYTFIDDFRRAQALTTTPGENGWTVKDTSAAGTPTYLCTSDGMVLTLAANSEAEIVTLYTNDVKPFTLEDGIQSIEWVVKVSGIDAVTTLSVGVASAQNDTPDTVQECAWFSVQGAVSTSNIVAESDDNTTSNRDKSTGATLSSTYRRLKVDFTNGLDDVRFYVDGSRRATATTFDMQAATAGTTLQPFIQLQKASGTGTPSVTIRRCTIVYGYNYGS